MDLLVIRLGRSEYSEAVEWQRALRQMRYQEQVPDLILLTEHPHTYTCGRATRPEHLLEDEATYARKGVRVFEVERGGSATYHGPGQLVGYPIVDLRGRGRDVHLYIRNLERGLIRSLAEFGLEAIARTGLTGVWCGGKKIGAIGIHVSHWVTMHGFSLNICPELDFFQGIVPCGLSSDAITTMQEQLPACPGVWDVASVVEARFAEVFQARTIEFSRADMKVRISEHNDDVVRSS